jgi:para-aminobenzoate synthetase / 4-amino-4-deoxychorismate lyase
MQVGGAWQRFGAPVRVIEARTAGEVLAALRTVETAVHTHNLTAAGYLSYEAAAAFDLDVHPPPPDGPPLLWFGLYRQAEALAAPPPAAGAYQIGAWRPALDAETYAAAVARIKDHIAAGKTYQVNFTFPLHADFRGDPWTLFHDLAQAQQAGYMAYLDLGRYVIASASPELFFHLDGAQISARPMKGTAARGRTLAEDLRQMEWLRQSPKERAENVMIVDMIRNDLGRVAETGSVQVPSLFDVERYPTLLQMTSTVTARTRASLVDIMAATFPCASITGAPKVRTMQLIKALEPEPRGVYTGAIGVIAPGRQAQFNVAIRTVVVDRARETAVYNVGSGIVWDADAAAEYAECRLKAQVLVQKRPSFALLESLLWTPDGGYFLLDLHLERLRETADYFQYPCDTARVQAALADAARPLAAPAKVRLLVNADGRPAAQAVSLAEGATLEPVRVGLAPTPVDPNNPWLYHKTTQRQVYDAARAARPDCDEVLLWNTRGELTEATSANVVVTLDGALVTPPVAAGLLPGTLRRTLLENGRIQEAPIPLSALRRATEIWLINSVRGWRAGRSCRCSARHGANCLG